ncbi:MAG: glycoside hydrolase family 55 protein, partial [Gemmataceae bacterium]|nr:glycoside hydrolase family 55 protein [Gemmataceae bacterium]
MIKTNKLVMLIVLLAPLVSYSADKHNSEILERQWVATGSTGKLEYKTTPKGDRIVDFSYAGYMGGGVAIPNVQARKEVAPSGGDDSAAIQAAIAEVSALPLEKGFRGAVLLKPGTFLCSKPITIAKEGVVLRGSGSGKDGTLIKMTGEPHTAFIIEGPDLSYPKVTLANSYPIADAYIPAGAQSFSVKDAKGLAVGDSIRIRWQRTGKWIAFMGMDKLVRKRKGQPDNPQTWMKEDSEIVIHRTIRSIEGNRLTLNVPLTDTVDAQLLGKEVAVVIKTPALKYLSQCGIESLQIVSPPHKGDLKAGKNIS